MHVKSRKDFLTIPLSQRCEKEGKSLVKVVQTPDGMFLSEWLYEDLKSEPFGVQSQRPMVYLEDPHEAIEKSMWCYERNMLPLNGEPAPELACFAAEKYDIDQLITDAVFLPKLLPYLEKRGKPLKSLSILGERFDAASLLPFAGFAERTRLVLTLPEAGVIAEAPLAAEPRFALVPDVDAVAGETLVVTKKRPLVTPINNYDTGLKVGPVAGDTQRFVLR